MRSVSLEEGKNGRPYARGPDAVLPDGMLTSRYAGDVRMPAGAKRPDTAGK